MESRRDPTLTSTKLMLYQLFHSHEKHLQNMKPVNRSNGFSNYSNITSGFTSKKNQIKRERENEIESQNILLLDKLYNILSTDKKPKNKKRIGSLNYPKRKREFGRINEENLSIYKSIMDAKPSVNLKKLNKWNEDMDKYRRNISNSNRRSDPFKPIVTPGIASQYPNLRAKTTANSVRTRKHSVEIPSIEHFSSFLDLN